MQMISVAKKFDVKARRGSRLGKILLRQTVLWTFLFCLVHQFFLIGLISPLLIESGSMVPAFYGPRYHVVCGECRHSFSCGADGSSERRFFTCPSCGFAENPISKARSEPGERIVIDRIAADLSGKHLKRFDTIVFRNPDAPSRWTVKRVAALPGESIAFSDGNLRINGTLYRRTLDELRRTAIPYPYGRWIDASTESKRQIAFFPNEPVPHFTRLRNSPDDTTPEPTAASPVFYSTRNPYNQLRSERRGETNTPTDEILLRFSPRLFEYEIAITTQCETMTLVKTDDETLTVRRNEEEFATVELPFQGSVWLSTADRTFQLGDVRTTKLRIPLPENVPKESIPKTPPIVFSRPACEPVSELSPADFRDVDVRIPSLFFAPEKSWIVPSDGFFVLGDNTSISEDSRHWKNPFVRKDAVLGVPRGCVRRNRN